MRKVFAFILIALFPACAAASTYSDVYRNDTTVSTYGYGYSSISTACSGGDGIGQYFNSGNHDTISTITARVGACGYSSGYSDVDVYLYKSKCSLGDTVFVGSWRFITDCNNAGYFLSTTTINQAVEPNTNYSIFLRRINSQGTFRHYYSTTDTAPGHYVNFSGSENVNRDTNFQIIGRDYVAPAAGSPKKKHRTLNIWRLIQRLNSRY